MDTRTGQPALVAGRLDDAPAQEAPREARASFPQRVSAVAKEPVLWVPWLLAALPALWMAWFVLQGSHLQYNDYWDMMPRTVTPSGGLDLAGMFTFQNDHPVIIPQFLFWLNVHATGGSNIWLGLLVVAIVFAQVVLFGFFVDRDERRSWAAGSLVVLVSVLLFSRHGVHNFSKSMSGIAWLTANAFVAGAILARYRDRTWLACGLGVLASASYGTGLAVWPVLIVVGVLKDRRWLPDWRVIVVGVVPVVYFLIERPERQTGEAGFVEFAVRDIVEQALVRGGALFSTRHGVMQILAVIAVVVGTALSVYAVVKAKREAAPWIGIFCYGVLSLALISYGRAVFFAEAVESRYASLAAMLWIGVAGLVAVVLRWKRSVLILSAPMVVAAVAFSSPAVQQQRDLWLKQEDLAAGIRLGLAGDAAYSYPFRDALEIESMLEDLGHYPFNAMYDGDCGLLGERYDRDAVEQASTGAVESVREADGGKGVRFIAKLPDEIRSGIDCVVVGNNGGRIVGIGVLGLGHQTSLVGMAPGSEDDERLVAMAPAGSEVYRVLLVLDDGTLVQVGEPVKASSVGDR